MQGQFCPDDELDVDDNAVIGAETAYSFSIYISKEREQSASA